MVVKKVDTDERPKIVKENFSLAPGQSAMVFAEIEKEGYFLKSIQRKNTIATLTFKRLPL